MGSSHLFPSTLPTTFPPCLHSSNDTTVTTVDLLKFVQHNLSRIVKLHFVFVRELVWSHNFWMWYNQQQKLLTMVSESIVVSLVPPSLTLRYSNQEVSEASAASGWRNTTRRTNELQIDDWRRIFIKPSWPIRISCSSLHWPWQPETLGVWTLGSLISFAQAKHSFHEFATCNSCWCK